MITTKLIVAGVGGSGLAISVGAGSYFYLTSDYTIEQLLNKEKTKKTTLKKGLEKGNGWLQNWKSYLGANKQGATFKDKDAWELEGWSTIRAKEGEVPPAFSEKCESKLNDKVPNAQDLKYIDFVKFCTK